jgi:OPA family glycerol-3-phosphate transporter-like MFS transporter
MTLFDPNPAQAQSLSRWRVSTFWVMLLGYIGYYLVRGNLPIALPLLSQEFGYTNTQLGVILTFSELAYALGKFTMGPFADKIGGKTTFMVGMVGGIVFNFLFPLYSHLLYFTAIWCFARFFLSMGWSGIIKTIGEWYEPERNGTVMGFISVNFQFGGVLASLLAGYLISVGVGWKGLFFWPAIIVTFMAVAAFFCSKESPQSLFPGVRFGKNAGHKKSVVDFSHAEGERHGTWSIALQLLRVPLFRQVLVFSFFTTILRSFFMFWIPKFMVDMGMGNVKAAFSSAVLPFVGCLGTVALGWYTDRYAKDGNRSAAIWKMLTGLVLSLTWIALLVPGGLPNASLIIVLLGFSGLFLYGPYSMAAGAMSLDIAGPEGAGTCAGIVDGIGYIGGAIAAWGVGIFSDRMGWQGVFIALAAMALFTVFWSIYMSWFAKRDFRMKQTLGA